MLTIHECVTHWSENHRGPSASDAKLARSGMKRNLLSKLLARLIDFGTS